jgi:hypothetical protein
VGNVTGGGGGGGGGGEAQAAQSKSARRMARWYAGMKMRRAAYAPS